MRRFLILVALCLSPIGAAAEGDAERGSKVYKVCAACHMVGPKAKNRVGPSLNGVVSAPAKHAEGFRYSKALNAAAAEGLIWTPDNLDAFLSDPKGFLPKTKMSFRGLREAQQRADVIAYLTSFETDGSTHVEAVDHGFKVAPEVLALVGDPDYGEYLSGECTTCHQLNGGDDGIPRITGWDIPHFVTAMHAYRAKHRKHPVMEMVSARLADDEIAALAAYFKDLKN